MQASELFPGSGGRIGANELRPAWKVGQEFIESLSEGTDELWRADIANLVILVWPHCSWRISDVNVTHIEISVL